MSIVDTSTWKSFRVGDLFETHVVGKKVACPTGGAIAKARLLGGDTPRVTVSGVDNGIVGYFKDVDDANYRVYENCISVSFLGTVFYQKEPTSFDMKVHVLQRDGLNEKRGLYLASIIRKAIANFDYAAQLSSSMLPDIEIMLPATSDGEPDWAYMETYMQQVLDREEMFAEHLASLTAEAVADGHVVDTSAWKAFRMTDGLGFVCHHGSRLNKSARIDGDIPFITAGFENRGVSQFIGNDVAVYSDAITVDMFGNCFFQQGQCAGDDNVYFFVNNAISHHCKLFLSSAVHASVANRFDYSSQFRQSDADSFSVFLPATSDGAPDWAYMEQYMKDVMTVEALFADELGRVYHS